MAELARQHDNHVDLATFEVQGRIYALDVAQIREIVRGQEVTPLPRAPALIEGVIDLRGLVVPVVDLGRALHGELAEETPDTRIVLIEVDGLLMGLRVDAAIDVLAADAGSLEAPPALASHAGYDAVRAVVRRAEARPVLVLSLEFLLESVYRSALGAHEGTATGDEE